MRSRREEWMQRMQQPWALAVLLVLAAPAAFAQARAKAAPVAGIGLTIGAGFAFNDDDGRNPNLFRMGPRGWLWIHQAEKLKLALVLPLQIGFGNRRLGGGFTRSVTLYEIAPSARAAFQVADFVRPWAEFGMGTAIVTQRLRHDRFSAGEPDTRGSFLIRTAIGADFTLPKVEGLVVIFELFGIHARIAGHSGAEATLLVGAGYEF